MVGVKADNPHAGDQHEPAQFLPGFTAGIPKTENTGEPLLWGH